LSAHGTPIDPGAETRNRAPGEKPQLKLGRYEVVRELGKGAMGIVYLAKDPLIGRLVALKTIRAAAHADDDETKEFQQRFIREAQAAGILNHPSIVTVHDIGNDEATNTSFIAMEYVEGHNLKEVLNQGRALSFEQIGDIIAQVAEALDFAHAKGIVHRDVKPANIILVEGMRAKITDFGIAKIASGAANLTTTGQFLGTPNYMAPEQVKGAPVDGRTDIFALGICLYECLTRRKPFGGDSLTSISYKIVHEPFASLHEINPQIPEGYEDIVAACLAKDPTKRYQRARDLATALRAVIRGDRPVRPVEPALGEETMVTGGRERTVEVPFPEALDASPSMAGGSTRAAAAAAVAPSIAVTTAVPIPMPLPATAPGAGAAASIPVAPPAPAPAAPRRPAVPVSQQLRKTLTNVRTLPVWRRRIPAPIFIGAVALLVVALLSGIVAVRSQYPVIPTVDTKREARVARERQLRHEGELLLQQGRVTDAYAKYEELQRVEEPPKSPFVANIMQKLNAIRQQEEISKQQLAAAQAKFQEGMTFFNEKKFPEAIQSFQESFTINPNVPETAEYLKLAQFELQKAEAARLAARQQRQTGRTTTTTTAGAQTTTAASTQPSRTETASNEPVQITTRFKHPFTDGNIIVRIGGDIVASEPLSAEGGRFFRRRQPREISVSRTFPAKAADVQVWVTVPSQKINEQHTIPGVRFDPGGTHALVIRYDAATKRFTYELN
jgi:predicted Ser/Thr protein kinase